MKKKNAIFGNDVESFDEKIEKKILKYLRQVKKKKMAFDYNELLKISEASSYEELCARLKNAQDRLLIKGLNFDESDIYDSRITNDISEVYISDAGLEYLWHQNLTYKIGSPILDVIGFFIDLLNFITDWFN